MAKGSRGGKRALASSGTPASLASVDDITLGTVADDDLLQQSATTVGNFYDMTDDEKVTAIINGIQDDVPDFLSDSAFQRFMYNNEFDGKPQIVDDATLDAMAGQDLFRTVKSVYDSSNDVGYTGKEIAEQLQYGDFTRFSDTGGSAYGKGLYFSNDYHGSASYGSVRGNIKKTAMVRCKLNSNAKVIDYYTASRQAYAEMNSGSKLGNALRKVRQQSYIGYDDESMISVWALSKGYNVLTSSSNTSGHDVYFNVLDRSVLTMSSDIKATGSKWK